MRANTAKLGLLQLIAAAIGTKAGAHVERDISRSREYYDPGQRGGKGHGPREKAIWNVRRGPGPKRYHMQENERRRRQIAVGMLHPTPTPARAIVAWSKDQQANIWIDL